MATGIAPDVWERQDIRAITTACELLDKQKRQQEQPEFDDDGRRMSG